MIIGYEMNKKFSFKKEKKPIISYEIIDVVSWKKIDGYEITVYKVKINEHEYLKTETTQHRTVIYRHSDTCRCGDKYQYGFSNQDSFNSLMDDKLEHLKSNK